MTRFLLIRHARTSVAGIRLTGRMPDIPLTTEGLAHAEHLVQRLRTAEIRALYSSPLDRARQTACPLARDRRLPVHISQAFGEVHFGDWTGRDIASLEHDSVWRQFHADREATRIPGGESMAEVQDRAVRELCALAARHPHDTVAVFSHADVIRAAVCHFLGLRLNYMLKFQIDPCSISVLEIYPDAAQIVLLNCPGSIF
jgi:broad specificity phosphatase PhoE